MKGKKKNTKKNKINKNEREKKYVYSVRRYQVIPLRRNKIKF